MLTHTRSAGTWPGTPEPDYGKDVRRLSRCTLGCGAYTSDRMTLEIEPVTLQDILDSHRSGGSRPSQTIARAYERIRAYNDPALFITVRDEKDALAETAALEDANAGDLPLYGVPVAIKDNIDVAGLPTTAACPAFAYEPTQDATVVARLRAAGAVIIGKTNLDQFATGLVGTRSPYGVPRNPVRDDLIPGGSSSGSAAAVAANGPVM